MHATSGQSSASSCKNARAAQVGESHVTSIHGRSTAAVSTDATGDVKQIQLEKMSSPNTLLRKSLRAVLPATISPKGSGEENRGSPGDVNPRNSSWKSSVSMPNHIGRGAHTPPRASSDYFISHDRQNSTQEAAYKSKLIDGSLRVLERALSKDPTSDLVCIRRQEALLCHRALLTLLDPKVEDVKNRVSTLPDDVRQYLLFEFADASQLRRLESARSMRSVESSQGIIREPMSRSFLRKASFPISRPHRLSEFQDSDGADSDGRVRAYSSNDMDFLDGSMAKAVYVSDEEDCASYDDNDSVGLMSPKGFKSTSQDTISSVKAGDVEEEANKIDEKQDNGKQETCTNTSEHCSEGSLKKPIPESGAHENSDDTESSSNDSYEDNGENTCHDEPDETPASPPAKAAEPKQGGIACRLLHKRSGSMSPIASFSLEKTVQMAIMGSFSETQRTNPTNVSEKQEKEDAIPDFIRTVDSAVDLGLDSFDDSSRIRLINHLRFLDSWEKFNIFEVGKWAMCGPLVVVGFAVFERHGCFDKLNIPHSNALDYLTALQSKYLDNPYHNALHASDVGQTMSHFFVQCGLDKYGNEQSRFAALFSAFAHDVGHPGVTNGFLVQTWHPLAIRYNDRSPLEMMHASIAFDILKQPKCNLIQNFSTDNKNEFRKSVISMILATDNAEHNSLLARLGKVSQALSGLNSSGNIMISDIEQNNILEAALHAADISSSGKPWDIYQQWTERVCVEFRNQGDLEKERGLSVLPFMDRSITLPISRFQAGFIEAIVLPLYEAIQEVADLDFSHCLSMINENLEHWKSIKAAKNCNLESLVSKCNVVRKAADNFLKLQISTAHESDGDSATSSPVQNVRRPYHRFQRNSVVVRNRKKHNPVHSASDSRLVISRHGQKLFSEALE
uniref:Phosphodiesterase n=1 Tax=Mucochytrium quahogii TaxID=96639 RepID=A0A7S2W9Q1_9STRA|mmetsp:Transcript_43023/g.69090  ORF Transcript_43023/g.69090 Transcript_43023/m.69090 type:complete len:904 (-) Transcript_43023:60-2771(-)|eukprot:CAMPEP_0203758804 /NCGR_PEP_ID=MMETSP0098-20131031/11659_1 /ASSEMBLY_ACC=CAM_ASM_000208 /TAXON_ID=96639 /ORGANISM=" , Strain NY0313808BC1" /LENGTH=903 /DNA_ID=CAMNT_0050651413 /DNA_START=272 /DNA_END=2983 /DNA_ORIENTATION=-